MKSECEAFGTGYDTSAKSCQDCEKNFNEEFSECSRRTKEMTDEIKEPVENIVAEDRKACDEGTNSISDNAEESIPSAIEGESQESETATEEKDTLAKPKGGMKGLCRQMMTKGYVVEDIKDAIAERYIAKGKDEKYAKSRANAVFNAVSKESAAPATDLPAEPVSADSAEK